MVDDDVWNIETLKSVFVFLKIFTTLVLSRPFGKYQITSMQLPRLMGLGTKDMQLT